MVALPQNILDNIQSLAKNVSATGDLKKSWDAQIDLLLNEFNVTHQEEVSICENWTHYLKAFGAKVLQTAPEKNRAFIFRLYNLAKNQFNKAEYIKDKWFFNSNLALTENLKIYASKMRLTMHTEDDAGYISRAMDSFTAFVGDIKEAAVVLYPLSEQDYINFNNLMSNIPSLYADFTAKKNANEELIQIIAEAELTQLDPENMFLAWWQENEPKIDKVFEQVVIALLQALLPAQQLTDEQYIEKEQQLRGIFYSYLPGVEVFDQQNLCKLWGVTPASMEAEALISYRQFITKKLNVLPHTTNLSQRKTDFIEALQKIINELSGLSDAKMIVEKMACYINESNTVIDGADFYETVFNDNAISKAIKIEFLSKIITAREKVFFDTAVLQEKLQIIRQNCSFLELPSVFSAPASPTKPGLS